jgi:DNA-binding protein H-NS
LEAVLAGKQLKTMDVGALLALRARIEDLLAAKRKELETALAEFGAGAAGIGRSGNGRDLGGNGKVANGRTASRAKAKPKYQSRKDRKLKWSGRGMLPIWMREEMKGTKLKKENFLIK